MPDPTRKTISATQSPGLFGVSPYVTPWMLWQHFAKGVNIDSPADARMSWGTKMQPLIVQQAAEDLKLEVHPNAEDVYYRSGLLGCTRDANIICPDRGPGALETKCVFDYRTFMSDWEGGDIAPRHYEIQLQQQMLVGDGPGKPYKWGVLGAWVAGEVHYFERQPIPELWDRLNAGAAAFFESVQAMKEPDPFGVPIEIEWLTKLLPTLKGKVIDLSGEISAETHAEVARFYVLAKEQENAGKRTAEPLRAKLLALARDAQEVLLPAGIKLSIGGNEKSKRVKVYVPDDSLRTAGAIMPEDLLSAG
jgi:hypothetical protein